MTIKRELDVVAFGATGFTGQLVAQYLATHTDGDLRWAIAGRDEAKLTSLRERIARVAPDAPAPVVICADVGDDASLAAMASRTKVVLSTVGPFDRYGEPVVAACVDAGTHYCDITGEPAFVDRMIARYDERARQREVKIVHCCGFDSIPHDLGALMVVRELPSNQPITLEGFVRSNGSFSGGTWTSAVDAMARLRNKPSKKASGRDDGRRARVLKRGVHYEPEIGAWACPLPTIDPAIVVRSARALPEYGPDFQYGHYVRVKSLAKIAAGAVVVGGVVAMAQLEPTRKLLYRFRQPGEGPDEETRARGWFEVRFIGRAGKKVVRGRVAGGEPGYSETAKMLSESGLCLARDEGTAAAGVVTTAEAMGMRLVERLRRAGMTFEIDEPENERA
jgi:short subunit dehydrogenase-like uncharacterized protein